MQKFLRIILTSFISVGCCLANIPVQPAIAATGCDNVQFIFARGSGEDLGDTSYQSWQNAISDRLTASTLKYSFYELGSQSQGGAQYPAVAVAGSLDGFGNLLGAFVSAGQSFDFGQSVLLGRNELKSYLQQVTSVCPSTRFVLGGYSQGAMVISGTLNELDASKIIYAATFGDPKIYLPEGAGNRPDACRGQNLSNYRAYVPDCHTYEGILGSYQPYQPSEYLNKLGTWCNGQDMMCSSGLSISDHTAYSSLGLYHNAANTIVSKLRQHFPTSFTTQGEDIAPSTSSPHDLAIIIQLERHYQTAYFFKTKLIAQNLANQIYSLGGRVALYVYHDTANAEPDIFCDFTCSADEFRQMLGKLNYYRFSGEYSDQSLAVAHQAMSELSWQAGANKSLVLLTSQYNPQSNPHQPQLAEIARLSISIDPVNIYGFTPKNYIATMAPLAQATNGKVYDIDAYETGITEITQRTAQDVQILDIYDNQNFIPASISGLNVTQLSATEYRLDFETDADQILVAINDTPIGQLPATQKYLTIGDVTKGTTVRLIPYSNQTGRGTAASVTLGPNSETTPPPSSTAPTQPALPVIPTPDPTQPATPDSLIVPDDTGTFIPKAPNTGVRPR